MAVGQQFHVQSDRRRRAALGQKYRKKSGVFATPSTFTAGAGSTRSSVLKAAEIFAVKARANAAKFSTRIPAATVVIPYTDDTAQVVTDGSAAPNAAPFEFGERHPLNYPNQVKSLNRHGRPKHWVKQPKRPYMQRAATSSATLKTAVDVYGEAERLLLSEECDFTE